MYEKFGDVNKDYKARRFQQNDKFLFKNTFFQFRLTDKNFQKKLIKKN